LYIASLSAYFLISMKHVLLFLGSGLLTGVAHAQVGLRAGGTLSRYTEAGTVHTDYGFTYARAQSSPKIGYQVGVYYAQKLSARLALVPEVQLSREQVRVRAMNYALPDAHYDSDYTVRATYLNVPVLLRWQVGPVYVEAGPQAGVLLAGREEGAVTTTTVSWGGSVTQPLNQPTTDSYRRFDIGPCLGVGLQLPAGLGLSLRAYQGLRDLTGVTEVTYAPAPYVSGQRRQSLQASLTYQLTGEQ
jgi:hypothetical protein